MFIIKYLMNNYLTILISLLVGVYIGFMISILLTNNMNNSHVEKLNEIVGYYNYEYTFVSNDNKNLHVVIYNKFDIQSNKIIEILRTKDELQYISNAIICNITNKIIKIYFSNNISKNKMDKYLEKERLRRSLAISFVTLLSIFLIYLILRKIYKNKRAAQQAGGAEK